MALTQDEHWIEAQKRLIKEAFALFDKDKKGEQTSKQKDLLFPHPQTEGRVDPVPAVI